MGIDEKRVRAKFIQLLRARTPEHPFVAQHDCRVREHVEARAADEGRRFAEMMRAERQHADTRARLNLCVGCAQRADEGMMTTCDECARTLCGYCARSLGGEDVVCPECYAAAIANADLG